VLPLVIALVNFAGSQVYGAWYARTFAGQFASYHPETPLLGLGDLLRYDLGTDSLRQAVPGVSFLFLSNAIENMLGLRSGVSASAMSWYAVTIFLPLTSNLLAVAVTGLLLGGYYGVVGDVVAGGSPDRSRFRLHARRNALRFCMYGMLLWLASDSVSLGLKLTVLLRNWSPWLARPFGNAYNAVVWPWLLYVLPVASIFVVFAPYAVALDGAPVVEGLAYSVRNIVRQVPRALAMAAVLVLVLSAVNAPFAAYLGLDLADQYPIGSFANVMLETLGSAYHEFARAAVGAWIALALCLWYWRSTRGAAAPSSFSAGRRAGAL
jgi:hypothetical protein